MVCQSAGQTRFRALKHENGTAGSATIIVKVIACFQPLDDCQAEYFRHLLKPKFSEIFTHIQVIIQHPVINGKGVPFGSGPRATIPCFGNTVRQEPCGWFYGLPRHRQGVNVIPVVNNKEQLQVSTTIPDVGHTTNGGQKKFLVFDQSGDQTTLIYSSGVGPAPIRYQFPLSNNPKPQSGSNPVRIKENDSKSEMREDTEELNALLYSDDDDDENDYSEETSTGHSPSSMMFLEQKGQNGNGKEEEVASSGGDGKKRKREDGGSIVNALEDTASSGESGVGNEGIGVFEEQLDNLLLSNKKLRKDKMKETINLLQNLIPGDKNGKSAVMVIDEAIGYLRSLKEKAKALGLDSL
ncbi:unnamed protein product [Lactuca virosa]|uniref:BHLH domain-containing protein n=1 Tax=Lactuca virosa TaxID=75947 RepID=A0AAU9PUT9_9ASTR|nr:unnamed protein product [Lactuca virosa]